MIIQLNFSFTAYNVVTRTNSNYFKKKELKVTRRFSDFLGLHDKLAEKYRQNGRIIPPAPDKSVVGMTKVKISKDGDEHQDEVKILKSPRPRARDNRLKMTVPLKKTIFTAPMNHLFICEIR